MKETDLVLINNEHINESQVPSVIQQQLDHLMELQKNVELAVKKAESAQGAAVNAKDKSAGLFKKKAAIESLQDVAVDLADAQMAAAEAQKISFEYQQALGEVTKYLFGLGVTSIAMNRQVVRELEMRLKNASEEELDDLARQEIIGVVKQLKAQEDIMKKQSKLAGIVKEHDAKLEAHEKKESEYDKLFIEQQEHERRQDEILKKHSEKDKEHDILIEQSQKKDAEHDRKLVEGEERDKVQNEEITRQAKVDEMHDKLLNQLMQSNLEHGNQIIELQKICAELSSRIDDSDTHVGEIKGDLDSKIDRKASKAANVVSLVIAVVALFFSIFYFFV